MKVQHPAEPIFNASIGYQPQFYVEAPPNPQNDFGPVLPLREDAFLHKPPTKEELKFTQELVTKQNSKQPWGTGAITPRIDLLGDG